MDYLTLILPLLIIGALLVGLAILKRRLFTEPESPAPMPMPDMATAGSASPTPPPAPQAVPQQAVPMRAAPKATMEDNGLSLRPARLYPQVLLNPAHMKVFAQLLKSLPGYIVLPRITYDHFLEARDGSPSENTSLQNRAAQQLADFLICDRKLSVLLVCQLEDGTHLPARIQEREMMLRKAGLRMLRWDIQHPPNSGKLLQMVRTLEKMEKRGSDAGGKSTRSTAGGS